MNEQLFTILGSFKLGNVFEGRGEKGEKGTGWRGEGVEEE